MQSTSLVKSIVKHVATKRCSLRTCAHNLHTFNSSAYYQLNSCLSSIYLGYWHKSSLKKSSGRFLVIPSHLTSACTHMYATDQFGRAQVANFVKASRSTALGNGVAFISAH